MLSSSLVESIISEALILSLYNFASSSTVCLQEFEDIHKNMIECGFGWGGRWGGEGAYDEIIYPLKCWHWIHFGKFCAHARSSGSILYDHACNIVVHTTFIKSPVIEQTTRHIYIYIYIYSVIVYCFTALGGHMPLNDGWFFISFLLDLTVVFYVDALRRRLLLPLVLLLLLRPLLYVIDSDIMFFFSRRTQTNNYLKPIKLRQKYVDVSFQLKCHLWSTTDIFFHNTLNENIVFSIGRSKMIFDIRLLISIKSVWGIGWCSFLFCFVLVRWWLFHLFSHLRVCK